MIIVLFFLGARRDSYFLGDTAIKRCVLRPSPSSRMIYAESSTKGIVADLGMVELCAIHPEKYMINF